jgi:hypothetical protein
MLRGVKKKPSRKYQPLSVVQNLRASPTLTSSRTNLRNVFVSGHRFRYDLMRSARSARSYSRWSFRRVSM